jgi:hypothetical protein
LHSFCIEQFTCPSYLRFSLILQCKDGRVTIDRRSPNEEDEDLAQQQARGANLAAVNDDIVTIRLTIDRDRTKSQPVKAHSYKSQITLLIVNIFAQGFVFSKIRSVPDADPGSAPVIGSLVVSTQPNSEASNAKTRVWKTPYTKAAVTAAVPGKLPVAITRLTATLRTEVEKPVVVRLLLPDSPRTQPISRLLITNANMPAKACKRIAPNIRK